MPENAATEPSAPVITGLRPPRPHNGSGNRTAATRSAARSTAPRPCSRTPAGCGARPASPNAAATPRCGSRSPPRQPDRPGRVSPCRCRRVLPHPRPADQHRAVHRSGRATRAHRDALLVVSHPADDLVPQRPRPLGNAPENLGALERTGQFGKLLILWDRSMAGGDRPITGTDRDHPHLVRTCLRPDLRPPLLRIDALRRADPATAQQLRIIAASSLEIVVGDPPKALVVLRRHAESRSSPDTESEPTPTAR